MSHYIVKSIDARDKDNIYIRLASSNVQPRIYDRERFTGTFKELYRQLISGTLKIQDGNKQKIHDAYLLSLIDLRQNGLAPQDLWNTNLDESEHYQRAFKVFEETFDAHKNETEYYLKINNLLFSSWTKHGYKGYLFGKGTCTYTDVLLAQVKYPNQIVYQEA